MVAKLANMLAQLFVVRGNGALTIAANYQASARPQFFYSNHPLQRLPTKVTRAGVDPIHGAKCWAEILDGMVEPTICGDTAALFSLGSIGAMPNPGGWWLAQPQAQPPFLDFTSLCHDFADIEASGASATGGGVGLGFASDGNWHNDTPNGSSTGPQIVTSTAEWTFQSGGSFAVAAGCVFSYRGGASGGQVKIVDLTDGEEWIGGPSMPGDDRGCAGSVVLFGAPKPIGSAHNVQLNTMCPFHASGGYTPTVTMLGFWFPS